MWRLTILIIWLAGGCSEQLLSPVGDHTPSPGPQIEVTPERIDFGLLADSESAVRQFRVTNIGRDVLKIKSIAVLGFGEFSLPKEGLEFSLEPQAHKDVEVVFTQGQEASSTDQVQVYSNDPSDPVVDVPLVGFGAYPPPYSEDDCLDGDVVTWSPDELIVASWNPVSASGSVHVKTAGWYAIYDSALSESGSSQTNESGILQISNAGNPDGWPLFGNCGEWWIVADSDNDGSAPSTPVYLGTFWLDSGDNEVTLHHYCTVYRSGQCGEFHNDTPSNGHCESSNWNSIHLLAKGVCLTTQEQLTE